MKVSFHTLGCKVNYYDTLQLRKEFSRRGYKIVDSSSPADIFIINTCTVTDKADAKCRNLIRRTVKRKERGKVVVTGCYAQFDPDRITKIKGVDIIVPASKRDKIFDILDLHIDKKNTHSEDIDNFGETGGLELHHERTRAFLKIQDGCNYRCSFCVIPQVRGKPTSRSIEEILKEAEILISEGFKEIVLTGINLGTYKTDGNSSSLIELLKRMVKLKGLGRIRLSSIEVNTISDDLVELMADSEKICPHLHIPLQSGDDEVLRRMKRRYKLIQYEKVIDRLLNRIDDLCIGTDIIVGFPGENDINFRNTEEFIKNQPFSYLHVFSFSPRKGTPAAQYSQQIKPEIKKERSSILKNIGNEKRISFNIKQLNKFLKVLLEKKYEKNLLCGYSQNYIKVYIKYYPELINRIVDVRILSRHNSGLFGDVNLSDGL
ncbi:MAG: tRNA (N(6)-L-threonylcarbamoyladenosine(37)-C(2))-methylthiotransferase MtaB [Fidelibacterota bacterium]